MKKLQAVLFAFIALIIFAPAALAADTESSTKVEDIKFFVENFYYGDIPENLHDMKTIEEVMGALDDYSRYMTAAEYNDYVASVGADDLALADLDKPGITSSLLYGDIGYIRVKTFSGTMDKEIVNHYVKLKKQGADKLILDLRYNGGGYVESAEQLLGHFEGVKAAYEMKTREGKTTIKPIPSKVKFPEKTYVLVNRYSASASEIVAASLQDQNAAIVVGEKTKGKGTIQSFFEFEDGSALKLTIGEFTGPKQKKIHHVGVIPTIKADHDNELSTIHERLIKERLADQQFKTLDNLKAVPTDKTFQIHFTQEMNLTDVHTSSKVELVKVGGVAVPIIVTQNGNDKLDITPNKQMQKGGSYYLVIHPGIKNTVGRSTKNGTYTFISVE